MNLHDLVPVVDRVTGSFRSIIMAANQRMGLDPSIDSDLVLQELRGQLYKQWCKAVEEGGSLPADPREWLYFDDESSRRIKSFRVGALQIGNPHQRLLNLQRARIADLLELAIKLGLFVMPLDLLAESALPDRREDIRHELDRLTDSLKDVADPWVLAPASGISLVEWAREPSKPAVIVPPRLTKLWKPFDDRFVIWNGVLQNLIKFEQQRIECERVYKDLGKTTDSIDLSIDQAKEAHIRARRLFFDYLADFEAGLRSAQDLSKLFAQNERAFQEVQYWVQRMEFLVTRVRTWIGELQDSLRRRRPHDANDPYYQTPRGGFSIHDVDRYLAESANQRARQMVYENCGFGDPIVIYVPKSTSGRVTDLSQLPADTLVYIGHCWGGLDPKTVRKAGVKLQGHTQGIRNGIDSAV